MADSEKGQQGGSEAPDKKTATATAVKPRSSAKPKPKQLPPYNVVLLNDDDHSYEYVIRMLQSLFGHPPELGMVMAAEVDSRGRVIVCTTHKELAELKRDQIHGYGPDQLIASCKGSMSAVIEPAPAP
jgi:ATP-dependent Clp protease adaptor protein ClpS